MSDNEQRELVCDEHPDGIEAPQRILAPSFERSGVTTPTRYGIVLVGFAAEDQAYKA